MNRIDRAIAVISPGLALRRAQARLRARVATEQLKAIDTLSPSTRAFWNARPAHDAADRGRTVGDWPADLYSADGAILPEARVIIARARAAKRNNWAARSAADAYRRHVVGIGITPRASARNPVTGESLTDWNAAVDREFYRWATDARRCDIEGRKTFVEGQGMTIEEWFTAGESLTILHYDPVNGLRFQICEPEQLADDAMVSPENGNEVRGGIEVDEYGRPVAYWMYPKRHPLESFRDEPVRIDASRVIHFFRQERPRQTRGLTRLCAALRDMHHLRMFEEFHMVRARMEACVGAAVRRASQDLSGEIPGLRVPDGDDGLDANSNRELAFEPGMVWDLGRDGEVTFHDIKSPGSVYAPFVDHKVKHIAAACGLDYPTVTRDFSKANYSSQREAHLERDRETDPLQLHLRDTWCKPIRNAWINYAVLEGRIAEPADFWFPERQEDYYEADWQPPPKPWIDPSKEVAAAKMALELKLTTLQEICNQQGKDWRGILRQVAEEKGFAGEFDLLLSHLSESPTASPSEPRPEYDDSTTIPDPQEVPAE